MNSHASLAVRENIQRKYLTRLLKHHRRASWPSSSEVKGSVLLFLELQMITHWLYHSIVHRDDATSCGRSHRNGGS